MLGRRGLAVGIVTFVLGFSVATFAKQESFFDLKAKTLTGQPINLSDYKGKVVLVVNVASKCGNTPQYDPLQKAYEKYQAKGFVILGFPSNDFGQQEPGSAAEIAKFCKMNYGVTFPLFQKNAVKGADIQPVYKFLTGATADKSEVSWNFEKFLVDRKGSVVGRFKPSVQPDAPELIGQIEKLL